MQLVYIPQYDLMLASCTAALREGKAALGTSVLHSALLLLHCPITGWGHKDDQDVLLYHSRGKSSHQAGCAIWQDCVRFKTGWTEKYKAFYH